MSGVLATLAGTAASAQVPALGPRVPAWSPSGQINAATVVGDALYVGGLFEHVGPQTGTFATVDVDDASTIGAATVLTAEVGAIEGDGQGGWYVATRPADGLGRFNRIEHLRADGTRDPSWTVPLLTGDVRGLAVDSGRVFVVGFWFEVNGVNRRHAAAFDGTTGTLLAWDAQITETLGRSGPATLSVAAANGRVYVSGVFSHAQGQPRDGLVVLDAVAGSVLPYHAQGGASSLIVVGSRIYVGATPYDLDLGPIASWRPPTVPDPPYAASATAFYGTEFTASGRRIFAVDATTGQRLPFGPIALTASPGFSAGVSALRIVGDRLLLAGGFSGVSGQSRTNIAAVDATTGAVLPWAPLIGPGVAHLASQGDAVAVGGAFTSAGGVVRSNLAAIDLRTGRATPTTPSIPFPVQALLRLGDIMVVAGGGGVSALAFSISTGALVPWGLTSDGAINALATDGRQLFFGGTFTQLGGLPRRYLASLDLATVSFTGWAPSPAVPVQTLAVSGDTLFVAGTRPGPSGTFTTAASAYQIGNGVPLPFAPGGLGPRVSGFGFAGNRVLLAGSGLTPSDSLRWVDRVTGATTGPQSPIDRVVHSVSQRGGIIYAAGAVTAAQVPGALLLIDAASAAVLPAATGLGRIEPTLVTASDDYVVLGGRFAAEPGDVPISLVVFRTPALAAPRQLTSTVAGATVTLGWQAGIGASGDGFAVEVGTTARGAEVGVFGVGTATRVTGILGAGRYYVRVRTVGTSGLGPASSEIILDIPAAAVPPGTPGTLSASVTAGVVSLVWGAAGNNATTYVIEAGTASGLSNIGVFATNTVDTALAIPAPSGIYFVRVRAANAFGVSGATNEVTVVVP